jgi:crotonobetainyl-CoA:carnitine CoA-transferase CaiB-like acyl-CoA transferase
VSALEGLRVIELSHERSAYAGKLLADMGADVVLVEPPRGDATRGWPPFAGDVPGPERSLHFWQYQTSKRGIVIDLEDERGRGLLRHLVARADVVLEGEDPGRLARLGLDHADLAALRPELVMASITPFGRSGPRRDEHATDLTVLAAGGPVWSCGYDDHSLPPVRGLGNQATAIGGHYAVLALLTALLHRSATGEGQHIDVSLHSAANVTTEMASYHWLVQRTTVQRQTGRHAMEALTLPTQIRCADGRHVCTGVPPRRPEEFARLVAWLGSLGIGELEFPEIVFLRRGAGREVLEFSQIGVDDEVTAIFAAAREAMNLAATRLSARDFFLGAQQVAGIPVGVIYSPEEAYEDANFRARGFQVEVHHPELGRSFRYPGAPYRFEKSPWRIARRAPRLGEHTDEVLGAAGVGPDEIEALRAAGVIRPAL